MKVVFASDGSDYAQAALDSMLMRPWPDQTSIMVVHVVHTIPPYYIGLYYGYAAALSLVDETGRRLGKNILQKAIAQLKAGLPEVDTYGVLKSGNAADEIIDTARKWTADMIVVGSHGRTGIAKFFMGSVAEAILNRAPCSVEIIRRHKPAHNTEAGDQHAAAS